MPGTLASVLPSNVPRASMSVTRCPTSHARCCSGSCGGWSMARAVPAVRKTQQEGGGSRSVFGIRLAGFMAYLLVASWVMLPVRGARFSPLHLFLAEGRRRERTRFPGFSRNPCPPRRPALPHSVTDGESLGFLRQQSGAAPKAAPDCVRRARGRSGWRNTVRIGLRRVIDRRLALSLQ